MPIGNDLLMNVLCFSWLYVCIAWGSLWGTGGGVGRLHQHKTSKFRNKKNKKQFVFCLELNFNVLFLSQRKGDI